MQAVFLVSILAIHWLYIYIYHFTQQLYSNQMHFCEHILYYLKVLLPHLQLFSVCWVWYFKIYHEHEIANCTVQRLTYCKVSFILWIKRILVHVTSLSWLLSDRVHCSLVMKYWALVLGNICSVNHNTRLISNGQYLQCWYCGSHLNSSIWPRIGAIHWY